MSTSPPPHEARRRSISLSKLATIFAVTFVLAFGLCTASATIGMGANQKFAAGVVWTSGAIEAICLLGLLTIGIIALFRNLLRR
jgi:hypothetical protein